MYGGSVPCWHEERRRLRCGRTCPGASVAHSRLTRTLSGVLQSTPPLACTAPLRVSTSAALPNANQSTLSWYIGLPCPQGVYFYRIIEGFIDQAGQNTDSPLGGLFRDDPGGLQLNHTHMVGPRGHAAWGRGQGPWVEVACCAKHANKPTPEPRRGALGGRRPGAGSTTAAPRYGLAWRDRRSKGCVLNDRAAGAAGASPTVRCVMTVSFGHMQASPMRCPTLHLTSGTRLSVRYFPQQPSPYRPKLPYGTQQSNMGSLPTPPPGPAVHGQRGPQHQRRPLLNHHGPCAPPGRQLHHIRGGGRRVRLRGGTGRGARVWARARVWPCASKPEVDVCAQSVVATGLHRCGV